MSDYYSVKVTAQAQIQMREIAQYISYELKNHDAAMNLLDTLEKAISSLSQFPQKVALTDEEPWHSLGVHRMPVKNYLVYFWIDEENFKVQVTAVIFNKRNQDSQLSKMDWE